MCLEQLCNDTRTNLLDSREHGINFALKSIDGMYKMFYHQQDNVSLILVVYRTVEASLCNCANSLEPSMLAYTKTDVDEVSNRNLVL